MPLGVFVKVLPKTHEISALFFIFERIECDCHTQVLFFGQDWKKWYFVIKIILKYCEKKMFSVQEKLEKFEAEGREFVKFLRSREQFIQTVKGQNNFW